MKMNSRLMKLSLYLSLSKLSKLVPLSTSRSLSISLETLSSPKAPSRSKHLKRFPLFLSSLNPLFSISLLSKLSISLSLKALAQSSRSKLSLKALAQSAQSSPANSKLSLKALSQSSLSKLSQSSLSVNLSQSKLPLIKALSKLPKSTPSSRFFSWFLQDKRTFLHVR